MMATALSRLLCSAIAAAVLVLTAERDCNGFTAAIAPAFDGDDFIVAGFASGQLTILDANFTLKGYLDSSFPNVADVEFDALGNVVAISQNNEVRTYTRFGELLPSRSFNFGNLGTPVDFSIATNGNLLIGATDTGITEFTPHGNWVRQFGVRNTTGVEVVGTGDVWASIGGGFPQIRSYSLAAPGAGAQIRSDMPAYMFYSEGSQSMLLTNVGDETVREIALDGSQLRTFEASGLVNPEGVTRGGNGDVVVVSSLSRLYRWSATGVLLNVVNAQGAFIGAGGILWTGAAPVPEPLTIAFAPVMLLAGSALLRRKRL